MKHPNVLRALCHLRLHTATHEPQHPWSKTSIIRTPTRKPRQHQPADRKYFKKISSRQRLRIANDSGAALAQAAVLFWRIKRRCPCVGINRRSLAEDRSGGALDAFDIHCVTVRGAAFEWYTSMEMCTGCPGD